MMFVRKMLMKLTTGFNFINILREALALADPNCVKKIQLSHQYLFTRSASARVKAVHRMLMKLSPGDYNLQSRTIVRFNKGILHK